ncbi:hypothetical protein [Amycolatopsis sp. NPDC051128]|uniref:hypothetical protein n=1 Tax=Amycolatopsis sp. NPDC051128 TaxID=3155412 RepID=UPI00342F754E
MFRIRQKRFSPLNEWRFPFSGLNNVGVTEDKARERLSEVGLLWYVDETTTAEVIAAACALLVAGADGQALAELAGADVRTARSDLRALVDAALTEVGSEPPADRDAAVEAALRLKAGQILSGDLAPEALTWWVCKASYEDTIPDVAGAFAVLDSDYRVAAAIDASREEIDAAVRAEAAKLLRDER